MLIWLSILSLGVLAPAEVFGGRESTIFASSVCDAGSKGWTPWFNTQNPSTINANDAEDLATIRRVYTDAARCDSVANVEYSIVKPSNNPPGPYQTVVNQNGLFCTGSSTARCPDYRVRFCCPMARQLLADQCGQTFRQPQLQAVQRIINGLESVPHSFPWSISLQYKGVHDCGGVIVDPWNILTAAHCLEHAQDIRNYYVRIGAHHRLTSGELIPVAQFIQHPNYDVSRSANDIGIIKLAAPMTFSQEIQPICLTDTIVEPPLGATAFVAGWGNTVHQLSNSSSVVLRQARLRVISDCSMYFAYDPQKQICAAPNGPVDRDHGTCQGDSGGALIYLKDGRWFAGGVVSYAIGCGRQVFPTVFTKTAAYIDWIRATVNRPRFA